MKLRMKPLAQACALTLLAGSAMAVTPAGTTISNQVTATYQDANGNSYNSTSNIVEISIREVRAATLTTSAGATQEVATTATAVSSVHMLTNTGNVVETYTLAAANAADDTIDGTMAIYHDADGNGTLEQSEIDAGPITQITLAAQAAVSLIVVTQLPAVVTTTDTLHVTLTATDAASNVAADLNNVNITFIDGTAPVTPIHVWNQVDGGNCHAYTWVTGHPDITWPQANDAANALTYMGQTGHLVTLTTEPEDNFVLNTVIPNYSDASNLQIPWIGLHSTDGLTMSWVTGETLDYTNYNSVAGLGPRSPAQDPYALYENIAFDGTLSWGLFGGSGTAINSYVVEFDTACTSVPNVSIELTGAKVACEDADNDGATAPSGTFGTAILADMAPGECAVMRGNVANNGTAVAKAVLLYSKVFDDSSDVMYVPNSLARCEGDACTPEVRTDALDGDLADYNESDNKKAGYWFDEIAAGGKAKIQYSVKIK